MLTYLSKVFWSFAFGFFLLIFTSLILRYMGINMEEDGSMILVLQNTIIGLIYGWRNPL